MKVKILILSCLLILTIFELNAQQIVADTTMVYSYGYYCEEIIVEEYSVPDSLFNIHGKSILRSDSLLSLCEKFYHRLAFSYNNSELYSFRDFNLCISDKCFDFGYYTPHFSLNINYLIDNLKNIYLFSERTNEAIPINSLQLSTYDLGIIRLENLQNLTLNQTENLVEFIKQNSFIELQIPSLRYPINFDEDCGDTTFEFTKLKFRITGSYK